MMRCPYCKKAAHVRTSRYLSDNVKQSYLQCVNVFCSATFRTIESIDEVIRPPAETAPPEPTPAAAVPPRRVLDYARSSLRH
ncbi:TPA: ogr/Delta-like zinc finger family protein [Citrobacter farmeri]|uniref:ogr/Delta-like zinc finger family protein n=1 Tax=Citrobacter farmeri TaxID=67824 RepID=UPI00228776AD|nr:ogr/Delta-like zinc finger family protein [Citrobacter farmeri]MEC3930847.1 ogr/Delta-like zinc finger family protein [Citrobacter farmeri]HCW7016942.1 ogr/Delta-like zinc finger family protein [Citrobacter farmeri]